MARRKTEGPEVRVKWHRLKKGQTRQRAEAAEKRRHWEITPNGIRWMTDPLKGVVSAAIVRSQAKEIWPGTLGEALGADFFTDLPGYVKMDEPAKHERVRKAVVHIQQLIRKLSKDHTVPGSLVEWDKMCWTGHLYPLLKSRLEERLVERLATIDHLSGAEWIWLSAFNADNWDRATGQKRWKSKRVSTAPDDDPEPVRVTLKDGKPRVNGKFVPKRPEEIRATDSKGQVRNGKGRFVGKK